MRKEYAYRKAIPYIVFLIKYYMPGSTVRCTFGSSTCSVHIDNLPPLDLEHWLGKIEVSSYGANPFASEYHDYDYLTCTTIFKVFDGLLIE